MRDSRVDTWVRYENCHIVIFLSYILIHDHFFPFFVLFILFYFILFYFILFYFISFYFISFHFISFHFISFFFLFYFICFDILPKRAVERILFPH